jgi:hypothetical protein
MTWITGAKLLADRIGAHPPVERVQVAADAAALWHWCNVDPSEAAAPSTSEPADEPAEQL